MELTIEQALQRAVEAHKAGKVQDAESLYRAILQAQPNNPDANHNLGVIAVSLNKVATALPLLKIALEANPNQGQFWLSYIDALLKEKQFENARIVLEKGKKLGLKGEKVGLLEAQLATIFLKPNSESSTTNNLSTTSQQHKKGYTKKEKKKNVSNLTNSNQIKSPSRIELNTLVEYYRKGQHELGQNLAITLTKKYTKHPFAWKVLGALLSQTGKLQESVIANLKVVEISPNDAEARYNLGITLQALGRLEEAETSYKKAIAIKPGYVEAHYNLGITLKELCKLDEAEANYKKAIEIKSDFAEAYYNLGITRQELNRLEDAETSYKKAIEIKPGYAQAHYNLGITLQKKGMLDAAIRSYNDAISINPKYVEAYVNLGVVFKEVNRLEDAETSYKKAIAIKPEYAEAHSNLGNTLKQLGRLEDAELSYKKAIAIKPEYAEAHSNLGNTLKELGRLEDAEISYKKAIAIKPDYTQAQSNLGIVQHELGRLKDAETSYRKAILINPEHTESYINLSFALKELGRLEESEKSLDHLIQLKSNPVYKENAPSVTALLPFGRSGSLFVHSLFDGHPEIASVPGIYLKGWFGADSWQQLASDMNRSDWRERLVAKFVESHIPLFDASNKNNVPGKPFGDAKWLSKSLGFMEMGGDRKQTFVIDKNAFANEFLISLQKFESIDIRRCFELIHQVFEISIRGNEGASINPNGSIFYHIHNPNLFERAHFLKYYPNAKMLHLMRNPVQSLESWLLQIDDSYGQLNFIDSKFKNMDQLKNWSSAVQRIVSMFAKLRMSDHCLPGSFGVKIEDVKQNPRKTMPQLAARLGISNHPALYESSFCGLQYWGPSSKAVGKITGFDTAAIDQPIGRLFGPKDVVIFETLFWPLSSLYGYNDLKVADFRWQLMEIRPWLDEPLEFENKLYSRLPNKTCDLKDLPQYRRLHHLLHLFWNVLDREGTYQNMVQPLKLD